MAQSASTVQSDVSQVWAAELLRARDKLLSFAQGCNRTYEARVMRGGDTVRINTVGDITVNSTHLRAGADMTIQNLRTTPQTLVMDSEDDFLFYLDDVDSVQAVSEIMPESMRRAAYKLRDTMDSYIATTMAAGVATANVLAARTVGSGAGDSDAFELVVDMGVQLDVNNAPMENRWLFVPPWFAGTLLKDPRRTSFGTTENLRAYGSAYIGRSVGGLEIFVSNNVPVSGLAYTLLAGDKDATTLAEQINKYETNRHPLAFGDIHKGLHVYGAKVLRPDELVKCAVTQSTDV
jgi:hypothetical protein